MNYNKKQKQKVTAEQTAQLLTKAQSIAIFAHTRPDGDTLGASMALCLGLQQLGKHAKIFCDTQLTPSFIQFDGVSQNVSNTLSGKFDTMVAVDCGDLLRLGEFATDFDKFDNTITIDHHGGEYYSRYNCVESYSSTCRIVDKVLTAMNVNYTQQIATYLFVGLCTDTGNFSHSNADKDSFEFAGRLLNYDVDTQKIVRIFFKDTTLQRTKLLGKILQRMRAYYDDKLMLVYVEQDDLDEFGLDENATEGFVQYAINVQSALVGVSLCQHAPNVYKVSMRGKDFDVRTICQQFGGGGHLFASGCMVSGLLEDVIERIVRTVGNYL